MKVLSPKNAVVLVICLGCLPRLARSIPISLGSAISACRGNTTSLAGCFSLNDAKILNRDKDVAELELRALPFRFPDEIPPGSGEPREPVTAPDLPSTVDPPAPGRPAPPPPRRPGKTPSDQAPPMPHRPAPPPPRRPGKPGQAPPPAHPDPAGPHLPPHDPEFHGKPETENPGVGVGLGGAPKTMEEYQKRGGEQITAYNHIRKSGKPDTLILKTKEEVDQHPLNEAFLDFRANTGYKSTTKDDVNTATMKSVWNYKESDIGFNIRDTQKVTQITVRRAADKEGATVTEGAFDPDGKFLVYKNTFKEENDLVPDHVQLNEIAMQNFIHVAGANTKNLQAAFITNIKNKGFYDIIRENYFEAEQTFQRVVSFSEGSPEFARIIGSDNVFSKMFSYTNHHNALGDKKIEKIVVVPKQNPESDQELSIAIVFKNKN